MLAYVLSFLYIAESDAIEAGMTHEGTLFGVPAWLVEDGEMVNGTPKVPVLNLWCWLADSVLEAASYFMREDQEIPLPYRLGRKL